MAKQRFFSTAPISAMQDNELTGLDLRVLLWVSLHDGMSLLRGAGNGCFASNQTLFREVGCNYSAGCRSLSKLVDRGHLVRESKGRMTIFRVVFGEPDMLQPGNTSHPEQVASEQYDEPEHVASEQDEDAEYVAEPDQQDTENIYEPPSQYIPLNGELNSSEEGGKYSVETARRAKSATRDYDSISPESSRSGKRKYPAEAGLGRRERVSIAALLPRSFHQLPTEAQLSSFDRAFKELDRDPNAIEPEERKEFESWLYATADAFAGEQVGYQAHRLMEEFG